MAIVKSSILIITPFFSPGFRGGGPVQSVRNIVNQLNSEFDFWILTSDRDLGDSGGYPDIPTDEWTLAYGAHVRYCSPEQLRLTALAQTIKETPHSLLYLNSFFSPCFSIYPLIARWLGYLPSNPTILAPRGEFSPGALAIKKHKKRGYIFAGKAIGLFTNIHWHASTPHEVADIRSALNVADDDVFVASNLTSSIADRPPHHLPRRPDSPLRIIFFSRISPKKNLDFVLTVLADFDLPVHLDIVGPEEDTLYCAKCRALAKSVPSNVVIEWKGSISPDRVPQAMADHDLLFLPSHGENFGHVIAEALASGTPVLLSDKTPWRHLEELGVGRDLPLSSVKLFHDALREFWHQTPADAAKMRHQAFSYARARIQDNADVIANKLLFRNALLTSGSIPIKPKEYST